LLQLTDILHHLALTRLIHPNLLSWHFNNADNNDSTTDLGLVDDDISRFSVNADKNNKKNGNDNINNIFSQLQHQQPESDDEFKKHGNTRT
jgi:hypothetical protein